MKNPNRIYFPGNPYPAGHHIKEFIWSGRIDEDESLWFDFHLVSEDYYAEDDAYDYYEDEDEEDEDEEEWDLKAVWYNSGKCTLSSTYWPSPKGFRLISTADKFEFGSIEQNDLVADSLPLEDGFDFEALAFHIYLLGHDSCANHRMSFTKKEDDYTIVWTGKIAQTYVGDYAFNREFKVLLSGVTFSGFTYPKQWTLERATEVFRRKLANFDSYAFVDKNPKSNIREYKLMRSV